MVEEWRRDGQLVIVRGGATDANQVRASKTRTEPVMPCHWTR